MRRKPDNYYDDPSILLTAEETMYIDNRVAGKPVIESYTLSYNPPAESDPEHLSLVAKNTEEQLRHFIAVRKVKMETEKALVESNREVDDNILKFVINFMLMSTSSNRGRDAYRASYDCSGMTDYQIDMAYPLLLKNKKVQALLSQYRKELEEQNYYSIGEYLRELNLVYEKAEKMGNTAVMAAMVQARGRCFGYDKRTITIKSEHTENMNLNMSIDDIHKKYQGKQRIENNQRLLADLSDVVIDIESNDTLDLEKDNKSE